MRPAYWTEQIEKILDMHFPIFLLIFLCEFDFFLSVSCSHVHWIYVSFLGCETMF
jgi:hypothetical protein